MFCFRNFPNSGSIYPEIETTTQSTTTTTTTENIDKKKEEKEKQNAVDISDKIKEKRTESLKAEMRGFLGIITKFTDLDSLPKDEVTNEKTEIDQTTFRIRAVSY